MLVDAGVDTKVALSTPGGGTFDNTLLGRTICTLREKKVRGEDVTEEQLNGLEGICRFCGWRLFMQSLGCGTPNPP